MKQTNNAIAFLVAQYRAIFKNAYAKGLATAVIFTSALSVGAVQAAESTTTPAALTNDTFKSASGDVVIDGTGADTNAFSALTLKGGSDGSETLSVSGAKISKITLTTDDSQSVSNYIQAGSATALQVTTKAALELEGANTQLALLASGANGVSAEFGSINVKKGTLVVSHESGDASLNVASGNTITLGDDSEDEAKLVIGKVSVSLKADSDAGDSGDNSSGGGDVSGGDNSSGGGDVSGGDNSSGGGDVSGGDNSSGGGDVSGGDSSDSSGSSGTGNSDGSSESTGTGDSDGSSESTDTGESADGSNEAAVASVLSLLSDDADDAEVSSSTNGTATVGSADTTLVLKSNGRVVFSGASASDAVLASVVDGQGGTLDFTSGNGTVTGSHYYASQSGTGTNVNVDVAAGKSAVFALVSNGSTANDRGVFHIASGTVSVASDESSSGGVLEIAANGNSVGSILVLDSSVTLIADGSGSNAGTIKVSGANTSAGLSELHLSDSHLVSFLSGGTTIGESET